MTVRGNIDLHHTRSTAEADRRGNLREIKSLLLSELQEKLREFAEPTYRAGQIMNWLYEKRASGFEEMSDLPQALRARLAEHFSVSKLHVVRVLGSHDTTLKLLFRLSDGNLIESVLIPASPALYGQKSDRRTACISTQVGCAYGCKFAWRFRYTARQTKCVLKSCPLIVDTIWRRCSRLAITTSRARNSG